ncbi:LOW QUALITY PROTEIN: vomeronasal type-1 receptor 90-like [Phodopus roborovskii]|uniref:LOW QUALITY PROTEIN: vomeronasal type-1 receptor 90-like n=1 Tax=Phodopus roborovskii TaxID=109678 RepID=UPI0021E3B755|nr:LOW QUALITY PROTEIN: vomeronasal type-1 receptor 90-like [Phodopus roborovskii]
MFSLKNVLYFQAGLGVLANVVLLFFYTFIILVHKSKPMDLISYQLTLIHIVLVLTGGDIGLMDVFESLSIENNLKCKTTFYINRVMRGLSICITCLLSVYQAVTISSSSSVLAKFKPNLKKYTIHAFFYIWSFNLSFNSHQIFYVGAFTNASDTNQMKVTKSCSVFPMNIIIRALILTVTTSRDVFLVGVMLTTSAYMVIILFRHQRQCKYLHSRSHLSASPEKRATQTILLLVVVFVVMYWVDFIISCTAVLLWMLDPAIIALQMFVMNVYPTITALVQISSDNRIINILKKTCISGIRVFKGPGELGFTQAADTTSFPHPRDLAFSYILLPCPRAPLRGLFLIPVCCGFLAPVVQALMCARCHHPPPPPPPPPLSQNRNGPLTKPGGHTSASGTFAYALRLPSPLLISTVAAAHSPTCILLGTSGS